MPSNVKLPGKLDNLYALMGFVTSYAAQQGFGGEKIGAIELALEEIFVNIIKHAYTESGIEGDIEVACRIDDCSNSLVIEIADCGEFFDICSVRDPDTAAGIEDRQIGGLGIYFVKRIIDEVRYRRESERNILTLAISNSSSSEIDNRG